ncbi:MAG: hypothetical protein VCD00_03980 [Candidatus Hydrogenedentota bacterium]
MEQYDLDSGQGFEQVDADAVCQQCGTVNEEGTLLCKVCGNNLRDQRNQRIAQGAGPELIGDGRSKFQMLTGLLVAFGILIIFYVVWNIDNFESMLVESLSQTNATTDRNVWTGGNASMYDEMLLDLIEFPTPDNVRQAALSNPQIETTYNGRYLLLFPGELDASRIVGEANLQRIGERIHFVFKASNGGAEIRGYAMLESVEEGELPHPIVRRTAEIQLDGFNFDGIGVSTLAPAGGHNIVAKRDHDDQQWEVLAYRVP